MTIVQNVVLPHDDVRLPLYVESPARTGATPSCVPGIDVRSRHAATLQGGHRFSFATYFNGFPATFWCRLTAVRDVTLRLRLTGSGRVTVYRSDATGAATLVAERMFGATGALAGQDVSSEAVAETAVDIAVALSLDGFEDGGWYWFDLEATNDVELVHGSWDVTEDQAPGRPEAADARTTIGITTLDKPDYCVRTLRALAHSPEAISVIDQIVVVDQGTAKVDAEQGFGEVAAALGGKLVVVDQPNLGGSGGFSRAMLEALEGGSASVLIMDDDVEIEPESVLRAVRFAAACRQPTIVGGHMFDLQHPTVLHSWSETVEQSNFMWGAAAKAAERHDLADSGLRDAEWMHRVGRADYNGWWMCLIPAEVLRRIGLAAPFFIKWDDAEYGLRAAERGIPTVSLPGVALWHISWLDKDDTIDWQAYFHERNRLVAALLHAERPRGGKLLRDYRRLHLKQLLCMQYYAVALRHRALRDVLAGPAGMHASLATALPEARALAEVFPETRSRPIPPGPPVTRASCEPRPGPKGLALALFTLRATIRHLAVPVRASRPQRVLAKGEATWWHVPFYDSVLVEKADHTGVNWYRREPRTFSHLWFESLWLTWVTARRWTELSARYRAAMPDLTDPPTWARTTGRAADPRRERDEGPRRHPA
ncbi:glycosyltransferase [Georgenia halophila]|uniref:Glycosyltransferase n=1 Tax=Georgenia halophila TaxID=620889 RepID=A0ABP8L4P2_9MICO